MSTLQTLRAGRLNALKEAGIRPANVLRLPPPPRPPEDGTGSAEVMLFQPRPRQKLLAPRFRIAPPLPGWDTAPLIDECFDDIDAREILPLAA